MNTLENILFYNGSILHSFLNWLALVLSIIPAIKICQPPYTLEKMWKTQRLVWLWILIGLFIFQILLCIGTDEVGISVIWSSMEGYLVYACYYLKAFSFDPNNLHFSFSIYFSISTIYSIFLWLFYCLVENFLTNLAHLCAILLGLIISVFCYRYENCYDEKILYINSIKIIPKELSELKE